MLLKAESLNISGSFKIRGALNCLLSMDAQARARGIVALSSGNHAAAVAQAAHWLDVPATIVMPADAPAVKLANTRQHSAEVVLYDRASEDREAIAAQLVEARNAQLVHPFNDPRIIAGQGTVGHEIALQLRELGLQAAVALIPCSGGGLLAGVGTALRALCADTQLVAVEPAGYDDYARSLAAGRILSNSGYPPTLCDGLQVERPGSITFAINARLAPSAVTVTDAQVRTAMAFAMRELKLVLEPSGAASLAALLSGPPQDLLPNTAPPDAAVVLVLSGGNADPDLCAEVLAECSG